MKEGKLKKIIKIDWTIFYSKPRIQILGILIFLDIILLFSVTKEMEKGFSVSSDSTSIVLFILFVLLNGLFIFYYKNKFPNIEFYDNYFIFKKEKVYYENLKYFFLLSYSNYIFLRIHLLFLFLNYFLLKNYYFFYPH